MSAKEVRLNNIKIVLEPNPQYVITSSGSKEQELKEVLIAPQQIQQVIITKSYDSGLTDVTVYVENIDPTSLSNIAVGKYIIYLFIEADNQAAETGSSMLNYFVCKDMTVLDTGVVVGNYQTVNAKLNLISITRMRLEIENNFPYELGGKGNTSQTALMAAADPGVAPYAFFTTTFSNLFNQNYSDKNGSTGTGGTISMPFTSSNSDALITSGPPQGYLMNCNTNMETLEYLRVHYPMFKTVYDWILDDFNTSGVGDGTTLFVTDFVKWEAWKSRLNKQLTELFNVQKTEENAREHLGAFAFLKIVPIHHSPFYNTLKFIIKDKYPKIYAEDIATGEPILMTEWNAQHNERYMLVASSAGLRVKQMTNPMYSEFKTFMTPQEIGEVQQYKAVFQNLHPEIVTYRFENAQIGDVDINTIFEIKKENLPKNDNYGYDRIALGYQARHVYTRHELMPGSSDIDNTLDNFLNNPAYTPKFSLVSEVSFLFVDEGPTTISDYQAQGNNVANREVFVKSSDIATLAGAALGADACATGGDGGGIPGNTSIADQAEHIVKTGGCKYALGHQCNGDKYIDCSGFVQLAVQRAGADKGYSERFPRTTTTQKPWCQRHAIAIAWEYRQRGDIVFFNGSLGACRHVGVCAGKDSYYEAGCSACGIRERKFAGRSRPCAIFRIKQNDSQPQSGEKKEEKSDENKKESS